MFLIQYNLHKQSPKRSVQVNPFLILIHVYLTQICIKFVFVCVRLKTDILKNPVRLGLFYVPNCTF